MGREKMDFGVNFGRRVFGSADWRTWLLAVGRTWLRFESRGGPDTCSTSGSRRGRARQAHRADSVPFRIHSTSFHNITTSSTSTRRKTPLYAKKKSTPQKELVSYHRQNPISYPISPPQTRSEIYAFRGGSWSTIEPPCAFAAASFLSFWLCLSSISVCLSIVCDL